jgi:predicted ABC-type ATPase
LNFAYKINNLPNLYIIAGCNGAGKTTASYTVLPEILHCKEFVNADEIARGLSPFQPENVAIQAGKIMLKRIEELITQKKDFAIETTLTTVSYKKTITQAKEKGYKITLIFFWLNDVNLAIKRVEARVIDGGHDIPQETIKRRYKKGLKNLFYIFLVLSDKWIIIDNSNTYTWIAENTRGNMVIHNEQLWNSIKKIANEKK